MNDANADAAVTTLHAFMAEMDAWEPPLAKAVRAALEQGRPQDEVERLYADSKAVLAGSFERYGITGKRNAIRLEHSSFRDPATYAGMQLESVDAGPGKVVVTTRTTVGLHATNRFTLEARAGAWRIVRREALRHTGKWEACHF